MVGSQPEASRILLLSRLMLLIGLWSLLNTKKWYSAREALAAPFFIAEMVLFVRAQHDVTPEDVSQQQLWKNSGGERNPVPTRLQDMLSTLLAGENLDPR